MHQINRTLLTILENQTSRTEAALEELRDDVFVMDPGADCHSIREIGRHLLVLRRFQMTLLDSPRAQRVDDPESIMTVDELKRALDAATKELHAAIEEHDVDDWFAVPTSPREGMWGERPTIERLVRPLNDYTSHLGSVRAIRRIFGNASERTQ